MLGIMSDHLRERRLEQPNAYKWCALDPLGEVVGEIAIFEAGRITPSYVRK
jgi:hypothetical protein